MPTRLTKKSRSPIREFPEGQTDPVPDSSNTQNFCNGDTPGESIFPNIPREHAASSSEVKADTLDFLDEIDASAGSPSEDYGTEEVTCFEEEMDTLHRFLSRVVQTPEAGFGTAAPDLARQLHELVTEHMDTLFRDRLTRTGVDPDHP